jgi:fatty-acyl-CoA synthase
MLNPNQRRALLDARYAVWAPMTVAQSLDASATQYPDRPLVITDKRSYSYLDIQVWSRAIGAGLISRGVRPGDRIALIMANFPQFVAIKYAAARMGAVVVSVNYLLQGREIRYILEQSECSVLITMDRFRGRNYLSDLDDISPGWRTGAHSIASVKSLKEVIIFPVDGTAPDGALDIQGLTALGKDADIAELAFREQNADSEACSDIIYTSGTTGLPKGAMLTHDMVLRSAYSSAYTRAFQDGRRIQFALPMYHVFGYVECLVACTFVGGAIVPHVAFDPREMVVAAERHLVNEIVCVPTMTLKMIEVVQERGFDCPSLVTVFSSGGASPPAIWGDIRRFLKVPEVMTAYGMTETTASTTCTLPEGDDVHLLSSNGRLKLAGAAGDPGMDGLIVKYKTIDPFTGEDLPYGVVGELMAKGMVVTKGYYNKPEETSASLEADGWLHTGDLGTISAEGFLVLTGRIKETYRCGGEMVMPKEIEDVLNTHPLVAQALVVGIPDLKMGEVGCVCVVPAREGRPDPQELIDLCTGRLARFKVPRYVVFLTEQDIPVTATGRPQKFRLAEVAKRCVADSDAYRSAKPSPTTSGA